MPYFRSLPKQHSLKQELHYYWLRYLKYEGTGDKELTDFIENDPEIKNAHNEYEKFLSDEHLQHLYLAREMYQHDEATRISTAKEEGVEKGHADVIIRMREKGLSLTEISELTGFSENEIILMLDQ